MVQQGALPLLLLRDLLRKGIQPDPARAQGRIDVLCVASTTASRDTHLLISSAATRPARRMSWPTKHTRPLSGRSELNVTQGIPRSVSSVTRSWTERSFSEQERWTGC